MRKEQLNNVKEFTESVSNNLTVQEIEKLSRILVSVKKNSYGVVNLNPNTSARFRIVVETGDNGYVQSQMQKYGTMWTFSGNIKHYIRALKKILIVRKALLN